MDIEGWEFEVLSSFLKTLRSGQPLPFGQLQIEIHAWDAKGEFPVFRKWWESLEAAGFRPFWTEPNLLYVTLFSKKPDLTEVSLHTLVFVRQRSYIFNLF